MKKSLKKIIYSGLICSTLLAATGCGNKDKTAKAEKSQEENLYKIKVGKTAAANFLSPIIQLA